MNEKEIVEVLTSLSEAISDISEILADLRQRVKVLENK